MNKDYEVAIVGAGIVGLAHAWAAAEQGLKVIVFERSSVASGASIRNFGMVWPIGQPAGANHDIAMRSHARWLRLADEAGLWVNQCGSLHLAHRPDELAVLEEFESLSRDEDFRVQMLSPKETLARTAAANPDGLLGSLWSPTELGVNPPRAIAAIPGFLSRVYGVDFQFATAVADLNGLNVITGDRNEYPVGRIVVCSGCDFKTLLPQHFAAEELTVCKLQMLRTLAQPEGWRIGPHLASGLTLRHYTSFAACPSLQQLRDRVAQETPELDRFGIHVMASQNEDGEVILGDSHEYDSEITPFDRAEIDELILREVQKQFALPTWSVARRWHGVYAKYRHNVVLEREVAENIHVCVGPGGAGMTMSFGIAERFWNSLT